MKWRANIRAYLRTYEILVVINLCSLNTSVRQSAVKRMYRVFAYLKHSTEKQRGNPLDSSVDYYNDYKKDYFCVCVCLWVSVCLRMLSHWADVTVRLIPQCRSRKMSSKMPNWELTTDKPHRQHPFVLPTHTFINTHKFTQGQIYDCSG